jgi:hypothetical protein
MNIMRLREYREDVRAMDGARVVVRVSSGVSMDWRRGSSFTDSTLTLTPTLACERVYRTGIEDLVLLTSECVIINTCMDIYLGHAAYTKAVDALHVYAAIANLHIRFDRVLEPHEYFVVSGSCPRTTTHHRAVFDIAFRSKQGGLHVWLSSRVLVSTRILSCQKADCHISLVGPRLAP